MSNRKIILIPFLLLALALFSACARNPLPDGTPPLHDCEITLVQGGTPLAEADVRFESPDDTPVKWGIGATSDSRGIVRILTHGRFPGAPEGTYRVTVKKEEHDYHESPAQKAAREKAKAEGTFFESPNVPFDLYYLVEEPYAEKETTPLTITIKRGKNLETFDVGEKVRISKGRIAAP